MARKKTGKDMPMHHIEKKAQQKMEEAAKGFDQDSFLAGALWAKRHLNAEQLEGKLDVARQALLFTQENIGAVVDGSKQFEWKRVVGEVLDRIQ